MGRCSRCNCSGFFWNPVATGRLFGFPSGPGASQGLRICLCGHHVNYHGLKWKEEIKKESTTGTNTQ